MAAPMGEVERREVRKRICMHLEAGLTRRAAAGIERIREQTISEWYHSDEQFKEDVDASESRYEAGLTAKVSAAAMSSPTAELAQWILERRFRREWGAGTKVEMTGEGGGPVQSTLFVVALPPASEDWGEGPVLPLGEGAPRLVVVKDE